MGNDSSQLVWLFIKYMFGSALIMLVVHWDVRPLIVMAFLVPFLMIMAGKADDPDPYDGIPYKTIKERREEAERDDSV